MHEPTDQCVELLIAFRCMTIDKELDIFLDYATARLIICMGIAMQIVLFM